MTFFEALRSRAEEIDSWVCVGLDPVLEKLPSHLRGCRNGLRDFTLAIVEATLEAACCFKPNLAFYLAEGLPGIHLLEELRRTVPSAVPIILDAKAGDIGSTAAAYARAFFETWGFDAVTVNPYVGDEAILPFVNYAERGVYVLARTSNPGSCRLQQHHELWRRVVETAREWNQHGNLGLVMGATQPEDLAAARQAAPDLPFLIPGVGAQGGDLAAAVLHGPTADGVPPVINSSRGIIYASDGRDFAQAARNAAMGLRDQIRRQR